MAGTELGGRIKQAREECGWTQSELARLIGLRHPQSVSNYERGVTEVSSRRLRRIAEVTRRPVSWFLEGSQAAAPRVSEPSGEAVAFALAQAASGLADVARRLEEVARVVAVNSPLERGEK